MSAALRRCEILGLDDDALHLAPVREVVGVDRAEVDLDGLVDVLEADAERRQGLLAVDHELGLRRRRETLDIDLLQDRALLGEREQLLLRRHQHRVALLGPVLEAEAHPIIRHRPGV